MLTGIAPEHVVAITGSAFFLVGAVLLVRSVLAGRRACHEFARLLPAEYAAHNSPMPGFTLSSRNNAYSIFIFQRKYEQLSQRRLVQRFAELHRQDVTLLVFIFAGFSALGVAWLWFEVFAG